MKKLRIQRNRLNTIVRMGLPVVLAIISGNILALADTAMVGRLGRHALAGVGVAGLIYGLGTALLSGVGIAVTAMVSRRKGAGNVDELCLPVNAALIIGTCLGVLATFISYNYVPLLFPLFIDDPLVIEQGAPYLRTAFLSMLGSVWSASLIGYWNGIGKTGRHLKILVGSQFLNIFLNYVLIFGKFGFPELGTTGAALSTVLSVYIAVIFYFLIMLKDPPKGFLRQLPPGSYFQRIFQLMLPSGVQAASGGIGSLVFLTIIAKMGTVEVAVTSILLRILGLMILPITGVGVACATLAGQALGRNDPDDAEAWGWDGAKTALISLIFMGIPAVFFPDLIIGIFSKDPDIIRVARLPLMFLGATRFVNMAFLLGQLLNGVGANKTVMMWGSLLQWLYLYPVMWVFAVILNAGYIVVWVIFFSSGLIQLMVFASIWRKGKWRKIVI